MCFTVSGEVDLLHGQSGGVQTLHLLGWCADDVLGLFIQKAALWDADPTLSMKHMGINPRSLLTESLLQPTIVRRAVEDAAAAVSPADALAIVPSTGDLPSVLACTFAVQALANAEDVDLRGATMWELNGVDTRTLQMLKRSGAIVSTLDDFGDERYRLQPMAITTSGKQRLRPAGTVASQPVVIVNWRSASRIDMMVELLRRGL